MALQAARKGNTMKVSDGISIVCFGFMNDNFEALAGKELFHDITSAHFNFMYDFGDLKASKLLEEAPTESATSRASFIASKVVSKYWKNWEHYLKIFEADYNPLYNVDGTESRTITKTFGKKVENEQTVDGKNNTTHGKIQESEQIVDSTTSNYLDAFNSTDDVEQGKTIVDGGKTQLTDSGTTNVAMSDGKHEIQESGTETTTDVFTRGGNIGTTKTTELMSDDVAFWEMFNFYDKVFRDIVKEVSIPMWGD